MYDKNRIEDSLEFVRQMKEFYDSDDSLDAFDPLEDNDTNELFANLAYNIEREERPLKNGLQNPHSSGAGFGSLNSGMQEQQQEASQRLAEEQRLVEERRRLEEEKERRRIAEWEEQRRQEAVRKQLEEERQRLAEEQKRQKEERERLEAERRRLIEERLQKELEEQKRQLAEQVRKEAEEQRRQEEERRRQEAEEQERRRQMVLAEQKRRQEILAEEERRKEEEERRKREEEQKRQQEALEEKKHRQQILAEQQRREAEIAAQQKLQEEAEQRRLEETEKQQETKEEVAKPQAITEEAGVTDPQANTADRISVSGDAEIARLQKRAEELKRQAEMATLEARMRQLQLESQAARGEHPEPKTEMQQEKAEGIPMPKLSIPGMQPNLMSNRVAAEKRKLSKEEIDHIFAKELQKAPNSDSSYQQRKAMLQKQSERLRQKREEVGDLLPQEIIREKIIHTKDFVSNYVWKFRDFITEQASDPENKKSKENIKKILTNVLVVVICIFVAFLLSSFITNFVAHPTMVEGESMETTLSDGDTVMIQKLSYYFGDPERYDIVVFPVYNSNTYYIKRVIGLPGETIQIDEGKVYINGKELQDDTYGKEDYIDDPGDAAEPITLASDEYFVLGDNRNMSTDSRSSYVGVIKRNKIAGKAWKRIMPFSKIGSLTHG